MNGNQADLSDWLAPLQIYQVIERNILAGRKEKENISGVNFYQISVGMQ